MQQVAAEMNLSETAFLLREGETFRLRWFTPRSEVKLCGHATLASAHVLWSEGHLPEQQPARFQTLSGELIAEKKDKWIQLDFPALPVSPNESASAAALQAALNVPVTETWQTEEDWIAVLESEQLVRELRPDFSQIGRLNTRGLIVTAPGRDSGFDFVSRFFVPKLGIDEDPVTGSVHCALANLWQSKLGKSRFRAFQASPRGGVLEMELTGSRVLLQGRAVTTLKGQLLV